MWWFEGLKRSITIDCSKAGGPKLVQKLAASCDMFVTDLVRNRAVRYGLTWVSAVPSHLVACR